MCIRDRLQFHSKGFNSGYDFGNVKREPETCGTVLGITNDYTTASQHYGIYINGTNDGVSFQKADTVDLAFVTGLYNVRYKINGTNLELTFIKDGDSGTETHSINEYELSIVIFP